MNKDIEEKIHGLLNSEVINYLESSERLILKNVIEKQTISEVETKNLGKIFTKYKKFLRN